MAKFIHLLSGGLDSTVLLYDLLDQGHKAHCILYDYGQRHIKELGFAEATCAKLGVTYDRIALPPQLFKRSALTAGAESLVGQPTIVPNRNMVLISMAASYALSHGCTAVSCAINSDDAEVYPDCRAEFIKNLNFALRCCHTRRMEVHVPYIVRTKAKVVEIGRRLNVPLGETWSCYAGGDEPCGQCGACQVRLKAIADACDADQ
jgi:7-cyano-7-deazaguanine synthase